MKNGAHNLESELASVGSPVDPARLRDLLNETVPAWLAQEVEESIQEGVSDPFQVVALAGATRRHESAWALEGLTLDELFDQARPRDAELRRVVRGMGARVLLDAYDLAIAQILKLRRELEDPLVFLDGTPEAQRRLALLALGRDQLACVHHALTEVDIHLAERLWLELESMDRLVVEEVATWAVSPHVPNPRLTSVWTNHLDDWWGQWSAPRCRVKAR